MLSLLKAEEGGSRAFIVKKGGDTSFCSRNLLAACLCTTSPGPESDGRGQAGGLALILPCLFGTGISSFLFLFPLVRPPAERLFLLKLG